MSRSCTVEVGEDTLSLISLNPTIRWRIAYVLTLFVPWGLIFNRILADACCIAIGVLWLMESYGQRRWSWLGDPVIKVVLCAWAWMLLISPFAVLPLYSFGEALAWIRFPLFYAAVTCWVLRDEWSFYWLGRMLAAMLLLISIDTWWQYTHGTSLSGNPINVTGRLTGPMSNVKVGIFMAKLLLPATGFCLFFFLKKQQPLRAVSSVGLMLGCIGIIMLSGERTAFFSSIFGTVCAVGSFMLYEKSFRKMALAVLIAIPVGAVVLLSSQAWVEVRAEQMELILTHLTSSDYWQLFKGGYLIGRSHWLTGAGFHGFRALCPGLMDAHQVTVCNLHPHNPYIEWFAETGLVGLALFILMLGLFFRRALQALKTYTGIYRVLPAFMLGTLVVHFFPFMPTQSFFSNWPAVLLWFSLSIACAGLNIFSPKPTAEKKEA